MIVKVQISKYTTGDTPQMLIYNKDHSVMHQDNATKKIIKMVGKEKKRFFYCTVNKKGVINLENIAPWQNW